MTQAARLRELTLAVYARGAEIAARNGILVADTKLEFGLDPAGEIVLADEVLTPDSSRFWDAATWEPGRPQDVRPAPVRRTRGAGEPSAPS